MTAMLNYAPNTPLSENPVFIQAWEQYQQWLSEHGMKTVTERLLSAADGTKIDREMLRKEFSQTLTLEQFCEGDVRGYGPPPAELVLKHFEPSRPPGENFITLGHLADIYNAWFYTIPPPSLKII